MSRKMSKRTWKPAIIGACLMALLSAFLITNRVIQKQIIQRQNYNLEKSIATGDDFISLRMRGDRYFESGFYNAAEAVYNRALLLASNDEDTDSIIEKLNIMYIGTQAAVDAYLSGVSAEAILNNPDQFVDQCGSSGEDSTDGTEGDSAAGCSCNAETNLEVQDD